MGPVTTRSTSAPAPTSRRPWVPSPFTRLARTHAFSVAGDTLFTAAMAGTVFFSVTDFDAARSRVALLLVFTIAPFAVAAPLLGPLIDRARGGRRWMILGIAVARAVLCVLIIRHRDTWLFFVEALLFLVLSRGYLIARGALVPTTVHDDAELVKANSRLALLSGVTAALAAGPAVLLLWLGGPGWVLGVAALSFVACAALAAQLPAARVASGPADEVELAELRSAGILVAASSMAVVRFVVGLLVFQVGFYAKDNDQNMLIVVAAVAAQAGFLVGSMSSPILRRTYSEERILAITLAFSVAAGLVAALVGVGAGGGAVAVGVAASLLSFAVAGTSNVGKQAFDAIVQRDAPDANRGRAFARFETKFQLVWVIGALVPTAVVLPMELAFLVVTAVSAFALLTYLVGRRRAIAGVDHRIVRIRRTARRGGVGDVAGGRWWDGRRSRVAVDASLDPVVAGQRSLASSQPAPAPGAGLENPPGIAPLPSLPDLPRRTAGSAPTRLDLDRGDEAVRVAGVDPGGWDGPTGAERSPLFDPEAPGRAGPALDPREVLDPDATIADAGGEDRDLGFWHVDDGSDQTTTTEPLASQRRGRWRPKRRPLP